MTEHRPLGILWVVGAACIVVITAALGYSQYRERRGVRTDGWVIEIDMTATERSALTLSIGGKVVEPIASGFEIYLGDSFMGTDRCRLTLETLNAHGVELPTSQVDTDQTLRDLIRNEFEIPGDFCDVGERAEEERSPISLLPRNVDPRSEFQRMDLVFVDWMRPGDLLDSFVLIIGTVDRGAVHRGLLLRLRNEGGVLVHGVAHSTKWVPRGDDGFRPVTELWLSTSVLDLPRSPSSLVWRDDYGARGWWSESAEGLSRAK